MVQAMSNRTHRVLNTFFLGFAVIAFIYYVIDHGHSVEDCEKRLYEKLVGQKAPNVAAIK